MREEDLSRGVSFWLTQNEKIQNSEMIRFLYLLVVAFFGVISATELSPTELKLMEQMLAVGFFLTRQIFILVLWLISYDKNSWDIALKARISEQYWTRAQWTRVSESGNSEPQVFISFFSVSEVSKKNLACVCFGLGHEHLNKLLSDVL